MTDENTGTTVVYWRRMCGFCARLLSALEHAGVDVELPHLRSVHGIEDGESPATVDRLQGA